jgi:hypothetical protein
MCDVRDECGRAYTVVATVDAAELLRGTHLGPRCSLEIQPGPVNDRWVCCDCISKERREG